MKKQLFTIKIIIVGLFFTITTPLLALAADGDLLWYQTNNPSEKNDWAQGVTVDSTGVYVVGSVSSGALSLMKWQIEKRNLNNGGLIWGITNDPSPPNPDMANAVAHDATGLYIVGYSTFAPIDTQWRIEKRNASNGSLIWTQTNNPTGNWDDPWDIALNTTAMYVVGRETPPSLAYDWHIEKRNLSDGSLIWARSIAISSGNDELVGVTLDSTGMYISGCDGTFEAPFNPDTQWRVEKRDLATGNIVIWSKTGNPNIGAPDCASDVAVDTTGVYVAHSMVEKRNLTNGNVIWSSANSNDVGVAGINSAGLYLAGSSVGDDSVWKVEKRNPSTGAIVWTKSNNPTPNHDSVHRAVVDDSGTAMYIVGFQSDSVYIEPEEDEPGGYYVSDNYWRIEKRELLTPQVNIYFSD